MPSGWRVAAPDFATSVEEMLSGEGSLLYGGRWNSKGVRVVYLGTSLAQASMELLVHLSRANVLKGYVKMEVTFGEEHLQHIAIDDLPDDWADDTMASSVQAVGDAWVEDQSSLILQVPSAAINGEYNYLLNPSHPDIDQVTVSDIMPHSFDPRVLK
ncbi:RES family NAD+ phosphorylase [Marinimicrobium sp. ABcell2]|uniref:RES family NAD+ phosphorylase n=1 Tax=Marinimicrobium sp. ABcell2 TaxID=3069751 RepID=UPI0027B7953B|nr:RES family NAD+ phosphorylase [Marinimicrobium sp. ABcell2]MDQ2077358.1 RES family NAD+ phosphorylase [Marinimicrobium sp. ABcell2]